MKIFLRCFVVAVLSVCACSIAAQAINDNSAANGDEEFNVKAILDSPDTYKGSSLTMVLRLKGFYPDKNILSFYDDDNRDIDFDVLNWHKDKRLRVCMRSLVNGLRYKVTFTLNDVQNGLISAKIESFVPVFYDKL